MEGSYHHGPLDDVLNLQILKQNRNPQSDARTKSQLTSLYTDLRIALTTSHACKVINL